MIFKTPQPPVHSGGRIGKGQELIEVNINLQYAFSFVCNPNASQNEKQSASVIYLYFSSTLFSGALFLFWAYFSVCMEYNNDVIIISL